VSPSARDVAGAGSQVDSLATRIRDCAIPFGDRSALPLVAERTLASEAGISRLDVQIAALAAGIMPLRYARNIGSIGMDGQARLLKARAVVLGAGGLGGFIVEGLARMGVGRIHVVDGDTFAEHNLNRQLLATEETLDRPKAEVAAERAAKVNGAVEVIPHLCFLDAANAGELLADADVAIDALDNIPARLLTQDAAAAAGIPLIHGAIAGFYCQVMSIYPGDLGLKRFYRPGSAPERGIEVVLGNPAATPMLCAALQVHEAVKALLGIGTPLRDRLLTIDALDCYADVQSLA
jgi:molybdopterin/thiamine biosynthesis adenylyltransferase